MISEKFIEEWKKQAPWQSNSMIEQDLIISRALVDLYNNKLIKEKLVFRGGTALNKIYINPPSRYSEDLDFVQITSGPIGPIIDAVRKSLKSWLGEPIRKVTTRSAKLIYKYTNVDNTQSKLKLEINTTEHFNAMDLKHIDYDVNSSWYTGNATISTYQLEELMATKIRALYQRRKGRDLFDLWLVLDKNLVDLGLTMEIFYKYCEHNNNIIGKSEFISSMEDKLRHPDFRKDMNLLLQNTEGWDVDEAFDVVKSKIIPRLK